MHDDRRALPPRREFTVKEIAIRERVDERTVRRWISKGVFEGQVRRTPGGHIRIQSRPSPPRDASAKT